MGKLKSYFERGFIGVLDDDFEITIYNDEYNQDNSLKELECELKAEDFTQLENYKGRVVSFKVTATITKTRKEEFNFLTKITINKIEPITNINNEIRCILKVTEIE